MSRPFDPGGYYAALDSSQWLALRDALKGNEARREEALDVLGALVLPDWLDIAPEPDMVNRRPEQVEAMRAARETHQDRRVRERCQLGLNVLQRQLGEDRPYEHHGLEAAGRILLRIAVEFLDLAREREMDAEAEG